MDGEDTLEAQTPAVRDSLRRRAVRRLWHAQTVYALVLACFGVLAGFAHAYAYFAWDLHLALKLQTLNAPIVAALMRWASLFGNGWIPWALSAFGILAFLVVGRRSEAAALLLSTGGGELVNRLIKFFIGRPRPASDLVMILTHHKTESFPSGHVTFYVCYFGFLFFAAYALLPKESLARRAALTLTLLPILLIGLSRIYLGAHWPSDVLGAYLFSGLWLAFTVQMYRRWKERATFHPEEKPAPESVE